MKRQAKIIVRTRVDYMSVNVRRMKYEPQTNGLVVTVRREGGRSVTITTYRHVSDASIMRIVRAGRAIKGKVIEQLQKITVEKREKPEFPYGEFDDGKHWNDIETPA